MLAPGWRSGGVRCDITPEGPHGGLRRTRGRGYGHARGMQRRRRGGSVRQVRLGGSTIWLERAGVVGTEWKVGGTARWTIRASKAKERVAKLVSVAEELHAQGCEYRNYRM